MPDDFNQYTSAKTLSSGFEAPRWVPDSEKERISAYTKYEQLYWNDDRALLLMRRGTEMQPILIPNPRVICDTTSHFLLKGLTISFEKAEAKKALDAFLKREKFYSKFMVAKHSGVVRGDFVLHITADRSKPEGKRISINSVDPANYFPITDDDDLDNVIGVHLVEAFMDGDGKAAIRRKTYREDIKGGVTKITVEELVFDANTDWNADKPPIKRTVIPEQYLPDGIDCIPVYAFKNIDWQGQLFGSSELRGFERIIAGVDQTISDEELALALEGLGVYATNAGKPRDNNNNEIDWTIGPGAVMEVPGDGTNVFFKRVEGIKSVTPMLDHVEYLDKKLMTASATFDAANIDVQIAQSGIALAIHFLPQTAKMEERELEGQDTLTQMFYDWCAWSDAFEGTNIAESEPVLTLGDKLPLNREERVAELNNMFDRKIISARTYRAEMEKIGYSFPADEDQTIMDEQMQKFEMAQKQAIMNGTLNPDGTPVQKPFGGTTVPGQPKSGNPSNPNAPTQQKSNGSNNAGRSNESGGSETGQSLRRQQKVNR